MTLLKNDGQTLPLDFSLSDTTGTDKTKTTDGDETAKTRIAIIGPNGNATDTMQGNYQGIAPFLISPLKGIEALDGVSVTFSEGCDVNSTGNFSISQSAHIQPCLISSLPSLPTKTQFSSSYAMCPLGGPHEIMALTSIPPTNPLFLCTLYRCIAHRRGR